MLNTDNAYTRCWVLLVRCVLTIVVSVWVWVYDDVCARARVCDDGVCIVCVLSVCA